MCFIQLEAEKRIWITIFWNFECVRFSINKRLTLLLYFRQIWAVYRRILGDFAGNLRTVWFLRGHLFQKVFTHLWPVFSSTSFSGTITLFRVSLGIDFTVSKGNFPMTRAPCVFLVRRNLISFFSYPAYIFEKSSWIPHLHPLLSTWWLYINSVYRPKNMVSGHWLKF